MAIRVGKVLGLLIVVAFCISAVTALTPSPSPSSRPHAKRKISPASSPKSSPAPFFSGSSPSPTPSADGPSSISSPASSPSANGAVSSRIDVIFGSVILFATVLATWLA